MLTVTRAIFLLTTGRSAPTLVARFALTTVFFNPSCPSLGRPFYLAISKRVGARVRRSMVQPWISRHDSRLLNTEGIAP